MPKAKLLVVDDEPVVLSFCKIALERHGFELLTAVDGLEGLNIFKQLHSEIDLSILDISMPKLDGIELARKMFELQTHPNILLMTGYIPERIIPAKMLKMCGVLMKPFTIDALLAAIKKCLESQRHNHPEISKSQR